MAKKFVYIAKKATFTAELQTTYAKSIVFIEDTQELFTHGKYFGLPVEWQNKITNLQTAQQALKYFSKVSDGTNVAAAQGAEGTIKFGGTNGASVEVNENGVSIDAPAIAEGTENGKIKVTTKAGAVEVPVHGLGSAAFTPSTDYYSAAQGAAAKAAADAAQKAADAAQGDIDAHAASKTNPHGVTKAQVGLDKVENKTVAEILTNAALTGSPTAPTVAATDNSTKVATSAMVQAAINSKIAGLTNALVFKGTIGTDGTVTALPANHKVGEVYIVATAGTYAGEVCEVGDMIICQKAGSAAADADWTVVQTNINGAVTASGDMLTDQIVLGAGSKAVKILAAGTNGQVLKMVGGKPAWAADTNTNTTYTFAAGTDGSFNVTPSGGNAQKVSIGKPATAGTADKVANALSIKLGTGTVQSYTGAATLSLEITPAAIGAAAASHNHVGSAVVLTGYVKGTNAAIAATDTVNAAFGKVQAHLEAADARIATLESKVAELDWEEL